MPLKCQVQSQRIVEQRYVKSKERLFQLQKGAKQFVRMDDVAATVPAMCANESNASRAV